MAPPVCPVLVGLGLCWALAEGAAGAARACEGRGGPGGEEATSSCWNSPTGGPAVAKGQSLLQVHSALSELSAAGREEVYGAELLTTSSYKYGRFEASIQWAGADGVISSFFPWKPGSARQDRSWNELDFEKKGVDGNGQCKMQLNMIGGYPGPQSNEQVVDLGPPNMCTALRTYTFEWTSDYIAWFVDGVQVRREQGSYVQQWNSGFSGNLGMQFRFNLWVGDYTFGGNFNQGSLPLYQYIDWARWYSWSPRTNGFTFEWQEDFDRPSMPSGWTFGDWRSPLGHSQHRSQNIVFKDGYAVLALTSASMETPSSNNVPAPGQDSNIGGSTCSQAGQDCRGTGCCADASLTCYAKDAGWAACMASCTPGIHPYDPPEYQTPWSCNVVGAGGAGSSSQPTPAPSPLGEENHYRKVSGVGAWGGWCTCPDGQRYNVGDKRDACANGPGSLACEGGTPGECMQQVDQSRDGMKVTCGGTATPSTNMYDKVCGVGGWGGMCTCPDGQTYNVGDNNDACGSLACEGGTPGECMQQVDQKRRGMKVTCGMMSPDPSPTPTPGSSAPAPPGGSCSAEGEDCRNTMCCQDSSMTCFEKSEYWGGCRSACTPGAIDPNDPVEYQTPWTCTVLGSPPTAPTPTPTPKPTALQPQGPCPAGWTQALWTYYISYAPCCQGNPNYDPAAGTGECDYYNACQWSGYFAYKNGQQSFDWVKSNNLVAFDTVNGNNGDFASKRIRVQAAGKTIEAQIVDTCGDSDCNGCCTRNANKGGGNLVDMEYWTVMNNFGSTDVAYGDICWQLV